MDFEKIKARWLPKLQKILPGADLLESGNEGYGLSVRVPGRSGSVYPLTIASTWINSVAGNNDIGMAVHAHVNPDQRGKGLGTLLNQIKQDVAREMGYKVLM